MKNFVRGSFLFILVAGVLLTSCKKSELDGIKNKNAFYKNAGSGTGQTTTPTNSSSDASSTTSHSGCPNSSGSSTTSQSGS